VSNLLRSLAPNDLRTGAVAVLKHYPVSKREVNLIK